MQDPGSAVPEPPTGHFDRTLKRLGEALADDSRRRRLRLLARRWLRTAFGALSVAYGIFLLGMILGFRWIGEGNLTFAFLLYVPRVVFLIPAAFLLVAALLFHRWSALALLAGSTCFLIGSMGFRPRPAPRPGGSVAGESLVVLTYNRGQHMNQSLRPFKNSVRPDLVALQESAGRAAGYLAADGYEEFPHAVDLGEFTLLSRYPILGAEPVPGVPGSSTPPVAARFTIDFSGTAIAVYSVHTSSPRDTLLYYRRGAFLYGLIGLPGTPMGRKRSANQAYWDQRIAEARHLVDLIASDALPTIVAGDFNAPAGGYIHGLFRSRFHDAHAEAGHGFGHTFPGATRNPLSLGGPWMRIDYLFCDDRWKPVWCVTEADRPSQHRAVAAMFRMR